MAVLVHPPVGPSVQPKAKHVTNYRQLSIKKERKKERKKEKKTKRNLNGNRKKDSFPRSVLTLLFVIM